MLTFREPVLVVQTSSEHLRFATLADRFNQSEGYREVNDTMTLAERADALEHRMMRELDAIIVKSRLFNLADGDTSVPNGPALLAANPAKHMLRAMIRVCQRCRRAQP